MKWLLVLTLMLAGCSQPNNYVIMKEKTSSEFSKPERFAAVYFNVPNPPTNQCGHLTELRRPLTEHEIAHLTEYLILNFKCDHDTPVKVNWRPSLL